MVFSALKQVSDEGLFRLYLLSGEEVESDVPTYVRDTLCDQGIVVEAVVSHPDEVPSLDSARSVVVGEGCAKVASEWGLRTLPTTDWPLVLQELSPRSRPPRRRVQVNRETKETRIALSLDLDGSGKADIHTGLPFFDHMLHQVARHGKLDLSLRCEGDLEVDEHHTVEDVAIVLGQAVAKALGEKRGISRYGFELLPMDECLAQVAIDFSGRAWFAWDVSFGRDTVGSFPTELFFHFFKSFCDEGRCNLHMHVGPGNTHHQAEALFKAFGRAIRRAVFRYPGNDELPSTKGVL
jgi:imidazoleglycerol-phosphate dehydratase/histidinol-phosphatase